MRSQLKNEREKKIIHHQDLNHVQKKCPHKKLGYQSIEIKKTLNRDLLIPIPKVCVEWRLLFGDVSGLIFGNLIFLRTKIFRTYF